MKHPELLLPVGNLPMAIAAIHGGADAIYVGVPGFNARGRTQDLSITELKELIDHCHLYGVKVHLAFNVLVFENELATAAEILKEIIPLGPDAFIVQDLGLVQLIREMAPHMRIHGSTQMTVTNDEAIHLLEDLSVQRFVLGRENSLDEIKLIRKGTERELEVFVHGALCVAYSGQCFTSESLGGRSTNRGQCAQSCRLSYEMYVDGEKRDLGDKKYLVSPQDLCGIEEVPALIEAGIDSFKVEGRLKGPEYVASAGVNYQRAIRGEKYSTADMATSYSRGFFSGWLHGVDHQRLVEGSYSAHRGQEIGVVEKILKDGLIITSNRDLSAGLGLLMGHGDRTVGAKIYLAKRLTETKFEVKLLMPFDYQTVRQLMRVWINSDEKVTQEVKKITSDRSHMRRVPLHLELQLAVGEKAVLKVSDPEGRVVEIHGPVGEQSQKEISETVFWDELGALGTTAFKLTEKKLSGRGVYLSQKDLKVMRREMVEKITLKRLEIINHLQHEVKLENSVLPQRSVHAKLNLVLREKGQVEDLVKSARLINRSHLACVILDYEFGKDYASSVAILKEHGFKAGIATTRILKPREYYNLNIILRAQPDVILVRNLGALHWLKDKGIELIGDFSLNATNHKTVNYLVGKGLKSVCASYDLNQTQLESLMSQCSPENVEITLHQYMPEFHMEHCVFAAFMSKGSSFKDCGKPCEKHQVELKDAYGNMHYLKADQECRNTLYRGTAQSAAFLTHKWSAGPGAWRFEALYERGEVLLNKVQGYLGLIAGEKKLADVVAIVGVAEKYGVTEGQLSLEKKWVDRKKDGLSVEK